MNKVLRTFLLSVILVATVCLILITPDQASAAEVVASNGDEAGGSGS